MGEDMQSRHLLSLPLRQRRHKHHPAAALNTFGPVAPVLLLPLVQQDVLVPRTLEEAKVAGRRRRREHSVKLPAATELVLALH